MMRKIQEKYSKKNIDYSIIKQLDYKIIRYLDDGYYNMTDNSVRRNLNWKNEIINIQSTVIDMGDLSIISRLHFHQCKIMSVDIEIAEKEEGPFFKLFRDMTIIAGNIKIVKVGNLPARFIKITVIKGSPIQDFNKLEVFGLNLDQMKSIYTSDMMEILLYNTYNLIYKK
jgi:hypothetical protein